MKRIAYFLIVILAMAIITGCKLRIQSTANGEVVSRSGDNDCAAGAVCNIDVVDIFFDDTFTARPAEGYVFGGWKRLDRHFCGGNNKPCRLYTSGFEGVDALLAFLATNDVFILSPDFIDPEEVLSGEWSGDWNNTTFGSTGAIAIEFSQGNNNSLTIDFDVDGNVFGQADPPPSSIELTLDGSNSYNVQTTLNGNDVTFTAELKDDGTLELGIPELPIAGLDSFEATGTLTRDRIKMTYTVHFTQGAPAVGTIDIKRS